LQAALEPFSHPRTWRATRELVQTFVPYLALSATMMHLAGSGHPWIAVALSVPAAAFLVRIFIIFHDCSHGSFLPSRRANRIVGYAAGILTLTPFEAWQRSHAEHHATAGNLDRRGTGDVWTLTVREYLAASPWRRLRYRFYRNPFVLLGIGPGFEFVVKNRWPPSGGTRRERLSVHLTNAAIATALLVAHFTVGLPVFLITQGGTFLAAATMGVWLFYVQHQFDDAYWARPPAWEPMKAALEGSSYYKLPAILQWLTGNIGLHHVHHVQPRIPFYNLPRCQKEIAAFQAVAPLTIRGSLRSLRLRLVDESRNRMVCLEDLRAGRADNGRRLVRS
jgi:omega-6 fatty acid desaturase (delta-12 desaturase)